MKRLNPETGKPFIYGYIREDGKIFSNYCCSKLRQNGYYAERWVDEEGWAKLRQQNKKQTKAYQRRRTNALQNYKLEKGCADCGYNKSAEALQFDHLPGHIKEFGLSASFMGKDKTWKEVEKCQVVCANCHAIRTAKRRSDGVLDI